MGGLFPSSGTVASLHIHPSKGGEPMLAVEKINLQALVGQEVQIGEAIVRFYEPRTPCAKMDALCQGLRELMENGRQGVMAEVVRSGIVRVGDLILRVTKTA